MKKIQIINCDWKDGCYFEGLENVLFFEHPCSLVFLEKFEIHNFDDYTGAWTYLFSQGFQIIGDKFYSNNSFRHCWNGQNWSSINIDKI